jgi:hypothetical protein
MLYFKYLTFLTLLLGCYNAYGYEDLFEDLEIVEEIDRKNKRELPLLYNYQLQGGYFTMPSARMSEGGTLGLKWASVPPYFIYNLLLQLYDRVELVGNYWVYRGKIEPHFGDMGFGDDAERAASIKFSILRKKDGIPTLPEFAVGVNDFIGTQRFRSLFVVATQTFVPYGIECSLGWGQGRIDGFYGGIAYTPFPNVSWLKKFTFALEYDANNYKKHAHEHAKGRTVKSRINAGIHWTLFDHVYANVSTLRGEKIAASAALTYNLGQSSGVIPKLYDPVPYSAPIDTQALGELRSQRTFAHEIAYALNEQGLDLYTLYLVPDTTDKLWMKVINVRYPEEDEVRYRIEKVLANLLPDDISEASVVIEADGVNVHQYQFRKEELKRFRDNQISEAEFSVVAPLRDVAYPPDKLTSSLLYKRKKSVWVLTFKPNIRTYFGSSSGKLKADFGIQMGLDGYLLDQVYYSISGSYTMLSNAKNVGSVDRLNPSQIVNVRSDAILYHRSNSYHVDTAFLQKSFSFGKGWFGRIAGGYFETAYAGFACEALYYPVWANWAIGFEGALLQKRRYQGLGFEHNVRKFDGIYATYVPYFGRQYFLDFYYQIPYLQLDLKCSVGEFLAHDKGVRLDLSRTFFSGLTIGFWWTFTNGNDQIGSRQYFDKGFSVTFPLDLFMNKSSKTRTGYGMAAWLRDVGAKAKTGKELYQTIYYERFNPKHTKPYP